MILQFLRYLGVTAAVVRFVLMVGGCTPPKKDLSGVDVPLQEAVENGDVVGVVAMVATSEEVIYRGAFGQRSAGEDVEMSLHTIFRIASMTKAVTSVAAMQLVEESLLQFDSPVSDYIEGFDPQVLEGLDPSSGALVLRTPTTPVTVRHLVTHTSGFEYEVWNPDLLEAVNAGVVPSIMENTDRALSSPLVFDPGSGWHYGISTVWLGRLVEVVRSQKLEEVFRAHIFSPLNMRNSFFFLPPAKHRRLPSVFVLKGDGGLVSLPAEPPQQGSFLSGGGGLHSTAEDYLRLLQMLLRGEELDGAHVLREVTASEMGKNQTGDLEAGTMYSVLPGVSTDFDFFPGSVDRFGLGFLLNTEDQGGRSVNSSDTRTARGAAPFSGVESTGILDRRESRPVCGRPQNLLSSGGRSWGRG